MADWFEVLSRAGGPSAVVIAVAGVIATWRLNGAKAKRLEAAARKQDAETFAQLAGVGAKSLVENIEALNQMVDKERRDRLAERTDFEARLREKTEQIRKLEDALADFRSRLDEMSAALHREQLEVKSLGRQLDAEVRSRRQVEERLLAYEGDGR